MEVNLITAKGHSLEIEVSALQMFTAYKEIILNQFQYPSDFHQAQKEQIRLNKTGRIYD